MCPFRIEIMSGRKGDKPTHWHGKLHEVGRAVPTAPTRSAALRIKLL